MAGRQPLARRLALSAHAALRYATEPRMPYRSRAALERAQRRRIKATIEHAIEHVPHYREACRRARLGPGDFRSAADFAKLPLIEREHVQRDPERFYDEGRRQEDCVKLRSGGSTGRPVTVLLGPRDLVDRACVGNRGRAAVRQAPGGGRRHRELAISPANSNALKFTRGARGSVLIPFDPRRKEHLRLSMDESLDRVLAAIDGFRPDLIGSYGSYIEELFTYAVERGEPFHRPKVVVFYSDAMSPSVRRMLMQDLGIEVLGRYQGIETPQIGFECERHRGYHLNFDVCPLRIVDEDGRQKSAGESGDVVISDLTNRTTVLLNYRLGDIAMLAPEPCDCGRTLPLLSELEGRCDEWTLGHDGRRIRPRDLIGTLSLDAEVWGYQIEQVAPGCFRARLRPATGADAAAVQRRVQERFATTIGDEETLEITLVDSLPRTRGGKVRRVVS
jgi:phenylacetate-CoA ligase